MSMFFNQNKTKNLHEFNLHEFNFPLFRDTNMAAVTSRESTLSCLVKLCFKWPKVHQRLQFSKMIYTLFQKSEF